MLLQQQRSDIFFFSAVCGHFLARFFKFDFLPNLSRLKILLYATAIVRDGTGLRLVLKVPSLHHYFELISPTVCFSKTVELFAWLN